MYSKMVLSTKHHQIDPKVLGCKSRPFPLDSMLTLRPVFCFRRKLCRHRKLTLLPFFVAVLDPLGFGYLAMSLKRVREVGTFFRLNGSRRQRLMPAMDAAALTECALPPPLLAGFLRTGKNIQPAAHHLCPSACHLQTQSIDPVTGMRS